MSITQCTLELSASGLHYRDLSSKLRSAVADGAGRVVLRNVTGQRYISTNLYDVGDGADLARLEIEIHGTPGNDLGAFLDGPTVTVYGNAMDGTGNTMNRGRIVVHGRAGDITGFSARGGEIFIRDNSGYRAGIHMKEYMDMRPALIIGGTTQDFLGEYMAGGVVVILGLTLDSGEPHHCSHVGTGMHGGTIFVRGTIGAHQLGQGVGSVGITRADIVLLSQYIAQYGQLFGVDVSGIKPEEFGKLVPLSRRPYQQLYAY